MFNKDEKTVEKELMKLVKQIPSDYKRDVFFTCTQLEDFINQELGDNSVVAVAYALVILSYKYTLLLIKYKDFIEPFR